MHACVCSHAAGQPRVFLLCPLIPAIIVQHIPKFFSSFSMTAVVRYLRANIYMCKYIIYLRYDDVGIWGEYSINILFRRLLCNPSAGLTNPSQHIYAS